MLGAVVLSRTDPDVGALDISENGFLSAGAGRWVGFDSAGPSENLFEREEIAGTEAGRFAACESFSSAKRLPSPPANASCFVESDDPGEKLRGASRKQEDGKLLGVNADGREKKECCITDSNRGRFSGLG